MFEMIPRVGLGPIALGMSPAQAATILGPAKESKKADAFPWLRPERKAMYKGQVIESRQPARGAPTIDLTYLNNKVVEINVYGALRHVRFEDHDLGKDRMGLLEHCAGLDNDIHVKSEAYLFLSLGFVISRPSSGKGINYALIVDPTFQRSRLEFDFFKPHQGPIIR
jgi:hypothetical protein